MKNPNKTLLRGISLPLLLAVVLCSAGTSVRAATVLISDTFQNTSGSTQYLGSGGLPTIQPYAGAGQSGSLAVLPYSTNQSAANDWKMQVETSSRLRVYGQNAGTVFGYATNFTSSGQLEIEYSLDLTLSTGLSNYGFITFGSNLTATQQADALSTTFRFYASNGSMQLLAGTGSPSVTLPSAVSLASANTIKLVINTPSAYDGSGTATIGLYVNGVQLDLNGASAGLDYSRAGLSYNKISWGGQFGSTLSSIVYDNISVTAVPEPSSVLLMGAAALVLGGLSLSKRRR